MLQLKTVRSFLPEKEGVAETTWNGLGLTATPIPCLPCTTGRDKIGELGLGRKEGLGEGVCKIHLYLSLLYCDSIGTGVRMSACGALLLARWANCGTCEFFGDVFFFVPATSYSTSPSLVALESSWGIFVPICKPVCLRKSLDLLISRSWRELMWLLKLLQLKCIMDHL